MGSLLSRVTSTAQALPSRVFLYAREKWGKSSLFAHAPGAIFFMTRGETGLVELIAGGRVPPTSHFPYDEQSPPSWSTLRQAIRELREEEHPYKFFVIDTCNGAEILCQEHVRNSVFRGSHAKFSSYGKGWDECRVEWLGLLQDLDALRAARKMAIVLLAHTQVKKFDDPTAEESYDKYRPACQEKLWDLTHKWADIICFGHFKAQTYETDAGKTKARNEVRRLLCFDQSPLWEAGNRYGLAGDLDVGHGAKRAFGEFAALVGKAKAAAAQQPSQPKPASPPAPPPPPPATQDTSSPAGSSDADVSLEGEHRADPLRATNSAPTGSAPCAEKSNASAATQAGIDHSVPMAGRSIIEVLIRQMNALDVNWAQIRDGVAKGGEIATAVGLPKMPVDFGINQLTAAEALRLTTHLEARIREKEQRAAQRAARRAQREEEEVGAAS